MTRKRWTLLAVCVATFMLLIDVTIVNVALPDIQSDLDASLSSLQWVVDAYALTLASFLLVFGSLGDRLGRRRVFTIGFGAVHLRVVPLRARRRPDAAATSRRGLQGVGGAVMFATSLALIAQEFQGRERGNRVRDLGRDRSAARSRSGRWSAASSPSGLGWEWIFFVNVPIGIAAIVVTETKLRQVSATRTRSRSTVPV